MKGSEVRKGKEKKGKERRGKERKTKIGRWLRRAKEENRRGKEEYRK